MHRIALCLLLILSNSANSFSQQNLVPNGDFEEKSNCPGNFSVIQDWLPCGTPDYFNSCAAINTGHSVPQNGYGTQNPKNGEGYAGLVIYLENDCKREYTKVQLKKKTTDSCLYLFRFYYSFADYSKYLSKNIGALFNVNEIACSSSDYSLIDATPQILNTETSFTDTNYNDWYMIDIILKLPNDAEWLYIGNFSDDENTIKILNPYGIDILESAYLYIDNVQLYNLCEDSTLLQGICIKPQLPTGITVNADGKNDKLRLMNPTFFNSLKLNLYDRWGHLLYSTNDINFAWDGTFKGERVPIGVYQWQAVYTTIYDNKEQYATGNVTVLY